MSTIFDGDDTISSTAVMARIRELESEVENREVIVTRDSDDEELGRFETVEDADKFVINEDYDPDKVTVAEEEEDEDVREELDELEEFERDVRGTFGSSEWNSGITLRSGDSVDEDFARSYYRDNYGDLEGRLESFVDWDGYADDLTDGRDCVELNSNYYYDI